MFEKFLTSSACCLSNQLIVYIKKSVLLDVRSCRTFLGGAISLVSVSIGAQRASTSTTQRFHANMERIRDHLESSYDLFVNRPSPNSPKSASNINPVEPSKSQNSKGLISPSQEPEAEDSDSENPKKVRKSKNKHRHAFRPHTPLEGSAFDLISHVQSFKDSPHLHVSSPKSDGKRPSISRTMSQRVHNIELSKVRYCLMLLYTIVHS